MEITYLGHAAFKLKGKQGTVVTDPFSDEIGSKMPNVSADMVTVSHDHFDHNAVSKVSATARRQKPFIVTAPGEYEVGGISVFGYPTFHDEEKGAKRGQNIVFGIQLDGVHIVHLGDLGHVLEDSILEKLGGVDVLMIPVGGVFTIDAKEAVEVIRAIEPSYIIPMHYHTEQNAAIKELAPLEDFFKAYGVTKEPVPSLTVNAGSAPENTELVVLK